MGGVDSIDAKQKVYSCSRKSVKLWDRLFYFVIDVWIVNAHILQMQAQHSLSVNQKIHLWSQMGISMRNLWYVAIQIERMHLVTKDNLPVMSVGLLTREQMRLLKCFPEQPMILVSSFAVVMLKKHCKIIPIFWRFSKQCIFYQGKVYPCMEIKMTKKTILYSSWNFVNGWSQYNLNILDTILTNTPVIKFKMK